MDMARFFLPLLALMLVSSAADAQTPGVAQLSRPSAFDNSYAGTLPSGGAARSFEEGRYGFLALFEIRVVPGVVKTLDVRQFYPTEQQTVEGFLRVQAAMPNSANLVQVEWLSPPEGQSGMGN